MGASDYLFEWQWEFVFHYDDGPGQGQVIKYSTEQVAFTRNKAMEPKCYPDWANDYPKYQKCVPGHDLDRLLRCLLHQNGATPPRGQQLILAQRPTFCSGCHALSWPTNRLWTSSPF